MRADSVPLKVVLVVFFLLSAASVFSHQSGLDLWIAHDIYKWELGAGGPFPLRDNFWLYDVIHQGGRALVKRLFFLTVALFLCSWFVKRLAPYRQSFLFILIATLIATGLISFLKHTTTLPCPQSLLEFGGKRHWIDFWQLFSPALRPASCYPAGHASGGYAWLCLAFVFPYGSKRFYWALLPGAVLGLCFGIAQQLRGAHFLSHDLMTIALCWLVSGVIFHLMRGILLLQQRSWVGELIQVPSEI